MVPFRTLFPAIPMLLALPALASESHVDGVCTRDAGSTRFSISSTTGPASRHFPLPSWTGLPGALSGAVADATTLSAASDASQHTMNALAFVSIADATPNDCTINTRILDTATVLPGGGFGVGDTVQLLLKPGFHGRFDDGPQGSPKDSLTSIDARASIELQVTPSGGCGPSGEDPGCFPETIASFTANVRRVVDADDGLFADGFTRNPLDPDGHLVLDSSWSWVLRSNAAPDDRDSDAHSDAICTNWPCQILVTDPRFAPLQPLDVSTSDHSIVFEVKVGDPISIDARMNSLVQALGGSGAAGADMLRTLAFSLEPAPGFEGIAISYESGAAGPAPDTTPPTILCGVADGAWHADNVSIPCIASDVGSGLADPSDVAFVLQTSVPAGGEDANALTGTRQVCDADGNCATAGPIGGNKVDRKPPTLTLPTGLTVDATGPGGAVVTYSAAAIDGTDPAPLLTCAPASGSTFAIGSTVVSCTATDHAANRSTGSFLVHVAGAPEQLVNLIAVVEQDNLARGIASSLDAKLANAMKALESALAADTASACNLLGAFRNEVEAQRAKALTQTQADGLSARAARIAAVIGCSSR